MLPSRAGDELFHKALRGEGDEIVDAFAHADEPHRQAEALLDGHHAAALRRAVELELERQKPTVYQRIKRLIHVYCRPDEKPHDAL